jgi:hypothetical protein
VALTLLVSMVAMATSLLIEDAIGSQKCTDGSYCSGATHCCGTAKSAMCCQSNWPCCGTNGCCESDELACNDSKNGCVCCETQFTFCCAPNPSLGLPSRCCPRFSTCCDDTTRFGCCSPGAAIPMPEAFYMQSRGGRLPRTPRRPDSPPGSSNAPPKGLTGYGLLFSAWQGGNGMLGMTIDITTGAYTSVPAAGFPTGGETPRTFSWDPDRKLFHMMMTNWSTTIPNTQPRPVVLWTVDPVSGRTKSNVLAGVFGQATGFAYVRDTQQMLLGTADIDVNQTRVNAYHFWAVNVDTHAVKALHTVQFAAGQDSYAGWFHWASGNGTLAYRLGNIDPTIYSSAFGITYTNTATGASQFIRAVPPSGHDRYQSLTPVSPTDFMSLAPSTLGDPNSDLDCVRWSPNGASKGAGGARQRASHANLWPDRRSALGHHVRRVRGAGLGDFGHAGSVDAGSGGHFESGVSSLLSLSPFIDGETDSVSRASGWRLKAPN